MRGFFRVRRRIARHRVKIKFNARRHDYAVKARFAAVLQHRPPGIHPRRAGVNRLPVRVFARPPHCGERALSANNLIGAGTREIRRIRLNQSQPRPSLQGAQDGHSPEPAADDGDMRRAFSGECRGGAGKQNPPQKSPPVHPYQMTTSPPCSRILSARSCKKRWNSGSAVSPAAAYSRTESR